MARITVEASIFGPRISVTIHDARFDSIHTLSNTRFDFKSRDSHIDLMARDSWNSVWVDCFRGTARLAMPRIESIPQEIEMLIYASWDPAFAVIEFTIGEDYCQFATRVRPGSSGRWQREYRLQPPPKMPIAPIEVTTQSKTVSAANSIDESSAQSTTNEADSSASTEAGNATASAYDPRDLAPIHVDFARIVTTPKERFLGFESYTCLGEPYYQKIDLEKVNHIVLIKGTCEIFVHGITGWWCKYP